MLEDEEDDESNVETFVVSWDDYAVFLLTRHFCISKTLILDFKL